MKKTPKGKATSSNGGRPFWLLDPEVTYLNHGSFGACPRPILDYQQELRARLEREPVLFLWKEIETLLDSARESVAAFVHCQPSDLAFVRNATEGINTVLRSLPFYPGDELLVTDHEYNACRNAIEFAAESSGASVVVAEIPFPGTTPDLAVEAILDKVTPKTRLALVDHITSQTALVMPISRIVSELKARGVETLVDGAHGPGMVELDLDALGAAFYTGNCHKWLCAPKSAAILHVRRDLQDNIRPLSISHGANSKRRDRSRFLIEFDWTGTYDPTPILCVPECIGLLGSLLPGGWPELMAANRSLSLQARDKLCSFLEIPTPCPDEMIGSMAAVPVPDLADTELEAPLFFDPLQKALWENYRLELPVQCWPAAPKRVLRVSAQAYNTPEQYDRLVVALSKTGVSPSCK